ncbi:MAG: SDR family oxidoreductase [Pseudomonadota bacterium]
MDDEAGQVLANTEGGALRYVRCDVTDIEALQQAVASIGRTLGDIAVLINNAANDNRHDVRALDVAGWDGAMAVNLRHQFFAAQAVEPMMARRGGGSIVNLTSIAWMAGGVDMIAYSTAKAGVMGLTNSLAREYASAKIRVNAIAPGAVLTERQLKLWFTDETARAMVERQLVKERLLPEHIADTALFLASDASAMITKQCLVVDAGLR